MSNTLKIVAILFLGSRLALASGRTTPGRAIGIGAEAPGFSLVGTDGKTYDLKNELKTADAAAVVFVATKCPYSNAYNERYNEFAASIRKFAPKRVAFFAINSNVTEPLDEIKKHASDHKFTFAVLKDEGSKIADSFGAERTPEAFLIDKQGKVLYHGRVDDDSEGTAVKRKDLFLAAEEHLSGKKISTAETKAFGCSIKRK